MTKQFLRFLNWLFGITPEHHDLCPVCGTELMCDGWEVWCPWCDEQNKETDNEGMLEAVIDELESRGYSVTESA